MGKYNYKGANSEIVRGAFNVYQACDGSIILLMGNSFTRLTEKQVQDLKIDCYGLKDFCHESFLTYYR